MQIWRPDTNSVSLTVSVQRKEIYIMLFENNFSIKVTCDVFMIACYQLC